MDYNLRQLGPHLFEQMVQALVVAEYGPDAQVFGKGPDGGREAVVNHYSTKRGVRTKTSTTVVQAKHVDVPDTDPAEGWTRFADAMRLEMRKWELSVEIAAKGVRLTKHTKRDRTHNAIIFVTNAALSAVPDTGGLDRFAAEFEQLSKNTALKHGEVWHYAKLCALLDNHADIRKTYLAGLLAGDVLARIYEQLNDDEARVAQVMTSSLCVDTLEDRYLSTSEIGDTDDRELRIADVFIDMPLTKASGVLSARSLVNSAIFEFDRVLKQTDPAKASARLVVVGGAGQGKTTMSRMLAQIYRHGVLYSSDAEKRRAKLPDALAEIGGAMSVESIKAPRMKRWPIRVVLSDYAAALRAERAKESAVRSTPVGLPLAKYIEKEINLYSDGHLQVGEFAKWMRAWPTLLILDGMDETPVDLRADIVDHIDKFSDYAADIDADVGVVITTRPQANGTDFDPVRYRHWTLGTLEPERGKRLATKVLQRRFDHAPRTLSRTLARLQVEIESESTGRLFSTPLQVSILTILLERKGRLPHSRFQLFNHYFLAMVSREEAKPGEHGELFQLHRVRIEEAHLRAGLTLHLRAETSNAPSDVLTDAELREIIESTIAEPDHAGSGTAEVDAILAAATDRLVFLTANVENQWEFEVRTIQEYMAARAIVAGGLPEDTVRRLLAATVSSTHWRGVWLLAAGYVFSTAGGNRDLLMSVINSADTDEPIMRWISPSGTLAVDLLADDVATQFSSEQGRLIPLAIASRKIVSASGMDALVAALLQIQTNSPSLEMTKAELTRIASRFAEDYTFASLLRRLVNANGPLRSYAEQTLPSLPPSRRASSGQTDMNRHSIRRLNAFVARANEVRNLSSGESEAIRGLEECLRIAQSTGIAEEVRELVLLEQLSLLLGKEPFLSGLGSLLSRVMATDSEELAGFPPVLAIAEARRVRSSKIRDLVGNYVLT